MRRKTKCVSSSAPTLVGLLGLSQPDSIYTNDTRTFTKVQTLRLVNQRDFKGGKCIRRVQLLKTCKENDPRTHRHAHTRTPMHPYAAIPTAYLHGHLINHGCFCDSPPRLMFLCHVGHSGSPQRSPTSMPPSPPPRFVFFCCTFHTTSFPQSSADRLDGAKVTGIETRDYLQQ